MSPAVPAHKRGLISWLEKGQKMKGTMLIYAKDRVSKLEPTFTVQKFDKAATLDELKAGLNGGYLETVPYFHTIRYDGKLHDCVAFCDEESKIKGLPVNVEATKLWTLAVTRARPELRASLLKGTVPLSDVLAGPVIVLFGDAEFMEAL